MTAPETSAGESGRDGRVAQRRSSAAEKCHSPRAVPSWTCGRIGRRTTPDDDARSRRHEDSFHGCPILLGDSLDPAVNKYALQYLSFDRFLQDRDLSKPAIDAFGTISGHKYKWHAPCHYRVGDGVDHFS